MEALAQNIPLKESRNFIDAVNINVKPRFGHQAKVYPLSSGIGRSLESKPTDTRPAVLVVDDEPMIAEMLQEVLSGFCDVKIAYNGVEGLHKLEKQDFSLVISDLNMPLMGGIDFYKNATAGQTITAKNFLFITGNPQAADVDFFEENGIEYFLKPQGIIKIRKKVQELLADIK